MNISRLPPRSWSGLLPIALFWPIVYYAAPMQKRRDQRATATRGKAVVIVARSLAKLAA